jgi:hypothetical protein
MLDGIIAILRTAEGKAFPSLFILRTAVQKSADMKREIIGIGIYIKKIPVYNSASRKKTLPIR